MNSKETIKLNKVELSTETGMDVVDGLIPGIGPGILNLELSDADLRLLLKNMISPFSYYRMVYDLEGNPIDYIFIYVNDAFQRETGLNREQIIGKRVLEVLPETEPYWIKRCSNVAQTGVPDHFINYASALNSWYEARVYSPQPDHFAMTVNNITDTILKQEALQQSVQQQKEANDKLFIERELLRTTLMSIGDGVICTDDLGKITMINDIAAELTGWDCHEAISRNAEEVLNLINEETLEKVDSPIAKVLKTHKKVELGNHVLLISKDGKERSIADCASPIMESGRVFVGTVLVFRDVTEKKAKQREIDYLGDHDLLTGLYNRRFFEMELGRFDEAQQLPVTFLMGDLNGLKFINDTFGHDIGDTLLIALAEILKKCQRNEDLICRYGGDEFVVVLPKTDFAATGDVVGQIRAMIDDTKIDAGVLSVAFGWATKGAATEDSYKVLKSAEDNMYKKKLHETPSFRSNVIQTIENTLYEKNSRECLHSKRVSELSFGIGEQLGLDENSLYSLKMAGRLHDIGKIILLDGIIDKPEKLTPAEWQEVMRHPEIGYRIICHTDEFSEISAAVLEHHERWDGGGYPKGLKAAAISLPARIIAVADAFDAMTVDRPYRKAMTCEAAVNEIKVNAGRQFDPQIVSAFLQIDLTHVLGI